MKALISQEVAKIITVNTFSFDVSITLHENMNVAGGVVIQFDWLEKGTPCCTIAAVTKHEFMRTYWAVELKHELERAILLIKSEL